MMTQTGSERPWSETRYDHEPQTLFTQWSAIAFLAMFPGYVLYHYGVNLNWWSSALGGLFGPTTAVTAIVLPAVLVDRRFAIRSLRVLRVMVFGLMGYMLIWSLINWFLLPTLPLNNEIMIEAIGTIIVFAATFIVGLCFPTNIHYITRIFLLSIIVVLVCFIHAYSTIGFPSGPLTAFSSGEEGSFATYQGVGRSLLVIGLMASTFMRGNPIISLMIMIVTAFAILTLGSRAHFFVLAIAILLQIIFISIDRKTRILGVIFAIFIPLAIISGMSIFFQSRASEIFDLSGSNSWILRQIALDGALEVIYKNPFIGQFGYHIENYAGYAHNILSAWTQYGLLGFLVFSSAMLYALYISLRGLIYTKANDPLWHLAFQFNLAGIILAVAFEPIMLSVFPALGWGFAMRAAIMSRAV